MALTPGEKIRVKGPNGNVVAVTVGVGFTTADLERMIAAGELELVTAKPATAPAVEADTVATAPVAAKAPRPRKQAAKKAEQK